ncbi:hypothetical protein ACW73L_21920 [Methylolobus aquaticus]
MNLTNLATGSVVTLPDDLLWADEHAWTPVVASNSYLLTGALLVQSAVRQAGRPITLVGPVDMAWVTRSVVDTLYDWAASPLGETSGRFELAMPDDRSFAVAFHHAATAIEAEPVLGFPARSEADFYRLTLRFLTL